MVVVLLMLTLLCSCSAIVGVMVVVGSLPASDGMQAACDRLLAGADSRHARINLPPHPPIPIPGPLTCRQLWVAIIATCIVVGLVVWAAERWAWIKKPADLGDLPDLQTRMWGTLGRPMQARGWCCWRWLSQPMPSTACCAALPAHCR